LIVLPGLEFIASHLAVRYRGSASPQQLQIHLTTDRPPEVPHGPLLLPFLIEAVNLGGAGGAHFAPSAGAARVLEGPVGDARPADPTAFSWLLEVTAMSPLFLRTLVERLAAPGPGAVVTSMTIAGELAPDGSQLSTSEGMMRAWLADDAAYPGAWPAPGFPIRERPISRGAGIRLRLGCDADHGLLLRFTRLIEAWNQAILSVTNSSGEYQGIADAAPRMSRSFGEVCAGYDAFDFLRAPAQATLVNMLTRFHEQAAPILEAQIALA
jgi:hypothetical protein